MFRRRYFLEGTICKKGTVENLVEALVKLPKGSKFTIVDGLPLSNFTYLMVERHSEGWSVKYDKIRKRGEVIDIDRCWGKFVGKEELKAIVERLEVEKVKGSFELSFCFFARDRRFSKSKLKQIMTYEPLKVEHTELELQIEDLKEGRVYLYKFEAPRECMCFIDDGVVYKNGSYYVDSFYQIYLSKLDFGLLYEILGTTVA